MEAGVKGAELFLKLLHSILPFYINIYCFFYKYHFY